MSGDAATSRCPCGVRKRAGATAATRTARWRVPSATRRRRPVLRISKRLSCRTGPRDIGVRAVLLRIALMWAFRLKMFERPCRGRRRRRTAPRRARALASRAVVSTTTAALDATTLPARPDTPTPARSSSMRICFCRRIQISFPFATYIYAAATRVACQLKRMRPRGWPRVGKFVCFQSPVATSTPSTRDISQPKLSLERRQVLRHDRLEGAAPRSPAQRHAPQRAM